MDVNTESDYQVKSSQAPGITKVTPQGFLNYQNLLIFLEEMGRQE